MQEFKGGGGGGHLSSLPALAAKPAKQLRNTTVCAVPVFHFSVGLVRFPFITRAEGAELRFQPKTSFEKNCFSAWASTLNMGLINKG